MSDSTAPHDDKLIIPDVGWWSADKHHFLARYTDAFTTAMKDKPWNGLHYIDLFAGAGVERVRSKGLSWGSPLIASHARFPFKKLHLCEMDKEKAAALQTRVKKFRPNANDQFLVGDANERIGEVVADIPRKALCLAFLDPYGLHLDYETVRALSRMRSDLIIFFPVELDVIRNCEAYYWDNPKSRLDAVLGPDSEWRRVILESAPERRPQALVELYIKQIGKLGYVHFEREPIPSSSAPLYRLIFCSKSTVGLTIWRGVSRTKPGGQRTMF